MTNQQWEPVLTATEHDYTEDWVTDEGMYQNLCQSCGTMFIGNRSHAVCKVCLTKESV